MAWLGYYEFDGMEIINVSRTEQYARAMGLFALRPVFKNEALGPILGQTYASPTIDQAPWVDSSQPESYDFLGVYPIDVVGVEGSTVNAAVNESVLDGGVVTKPRRATRTVVFSAALVSKTECGVEYGMRWLSTALTGKTCGSANDCIGGTMCYLSCEPQIPAGSLDPTECLAPILRSLHRVTATVGPVITAKNKLPSGGYAWLVTWTVVAGMPFEFMAERPVIADFNDGVTDFYVNPLYPPVGEDWFDSDGVTTTEFPCLPDIYRPVFDPECPQVIAPPAIPGIAVGCFAFPTEFERRFFTIPKEEVPTWGQVVPTIEFKVGLTEVRNLRLRFYSDVMETGDPNNDPCSYCGDIVFSYLPAGSTFIFDGIERVTKVLTPGNPPRRADAVVFKSDGTPFDWPELSCGVNYLVTLDLPAGEAFPNVSMSLTGKVA